MTRLHYRRSIRLPTWDYRERAAYFVTICTHERALLFEDERIIRELELAWHSIGRYSHARPDYFVAMPNHVHGIIWITGPTSVGAQHTSKPGRPLASVPHPVNGLASGTACAAPLRRCAVLEGPATGSVAAVVRAFKSNAAKRINNLRNTPGAPVWQRGYYERVIRDDRELDAVREYILDNPRSWAEDPNNPANFR